MNALDHMEIEFFRTFSRVEYALKAAGFYLPNNHATPDWRRFAASIRDILRNSADEELNAAVAYLTEQPPKKQTVKYGRLTWIDAQPNTDLEVDRVLQYVRRVRNNLFHGGKIGGRLSSPERNTKLLECSLILLRTCIAASTAVNDAYNG